MRAYELLFITYPDYDDEKISAIISRYTEIITSSSGTVATTDRWGKRRLAYEINEMREGLYILMTFTADQAACSEIDRLMKIDQDIVRHMISRLDRLPEPGEKLRPGKRPKAEEARVEPAEQKEAVKVVAEVPVPPETGEGQGQPEPKQR